MSTVKAKEIIYLFVNNRKKKISCVGFSVNKCAK